MAKPGKLVNANSLLELLGDEDDLAVYAKDMQLRLTYVSSAFVTLCGANAPSELLGKMDRELFPHCLSVEYEREEKRVLRSGKRHEVVSLVPDGRGIPVWSRVVRVPIRKSGGRIKGVVGVIRGFETMRGIVQPYAGIAAAVESIHQNYRRPLRLADLAKSAELSVRQFERRFKSLFGITPQQYLIRIRVVTACELLIGSSLSVAAIAERVGFSDNSGFTRHFSRVIGSTPLRYRRARERARS